MVQFVMFCYCFVYVVILNYPVVGSNCLCFGLLFWESYIIRPSLYEIWYFIMQWIFSDGGKKIMCLQLVCHQRQGEEAERANSPCFAKESASLLQSLGIWIKDSDSEDLHNTRISKMIILFRGRKNKNEEVFFRKRDEILAQY